MGLKTLFNDLPVYSILYIERLIFNSASHQTEIDTRSFYSVDFKKGEVRHESWLVPRWTMLVIGSLGAMWARWPCWTWTHKVQCESIVMVFPLVCLLIAWTRPGDLVLCCTCLWFFTHPKVAQPEPWAIRPRIYHWPWYAIRHECQTAQLKKGRYIRGSFKKFSGSECVWELYQKLHCWMQFYIIARTPFFFFFFFFFFLRDCESKPRQKAANLECRGTDRHW